MPSVSDPAEEQGMSGNGFPGVAAAAAPDEVRNPGGVPAAPSDLDEGSDDGAYHVPEEPVGAYAEIPVAGLPGRGCGVGNLWPPSAT